MPRNYVEKIKLPNYLLLKVIIAMILGTILGISFRGKLNFLAPVLKVYFMILQMIVYPFLISSIIYGIASLAPGIGRRLFKASVGFYILLFVTCTLVIWILMQAIPTVSVHLYMHPN